MNTQERIEIEKLKAEVERELNPRAPTDRHWHPDLKLIIYKGVNGRVPAPKEIPDCSETPHERLKGYINRAAEIDPNFPHLDEAIGARDKSKTGVLTSLQFIGLGCDKLLAKLTGKRRGNKQLEEHIKNAQDKLKGSTDPTHIARCIALDQPEYYKPKPATITKTLSRMKAKAKKN